MVEIKWLGHAGFKLIGSKIIYIDPWQINDGDKADLILITHDHYDHLSVDDIDQVKKKDTIIVTTEDCARKLSGNLKIIKVNDKINVNGVGIEAVPAYNVNKRFHPKQNNWVGYVVEFDGERIYHAGDTDLIPEMENLRNIDVALLPVSGTYVMTAEEAAEAVKKIKCKKAIGMHWGVIVGDIGDAERFKELAECEVEILEKSI